MSALADAIRRSFTSAEPDRPVVSPLRALGRRRLSGVEVLGQAVATTGPAASMVALPIVLLRYGTPLTGLLTIVGATVLISLVAVCVAQFTRRQAAAGGLYSFVCHGMGTRAALTCGLALLVKYLGSATVTLLGGGHALILALGALGLDVRGGAGTVAVYGLASCLAAAVLVRGARFALIAVLVVEFCSLGFIVALTVLGAGSVEPPPHPVGAVHGVLYIGLAAIFALAGFESATFFGPETKRPLVTITRTVLLTPMICGGLLVFAGWAAFTGRSATILDAAVLGSGSAAPPALVVALNIGLCCSWLASATASAHAASRLVYSMGVERLLPGFVTRVHRRFRTPYRAQLAIVAAVTLAAGTFALAGPVLDTARADLVHVVRAMLVAAYVLVALASLLLLRRIRELTVGVLAAGVLAAGAGVVLLGHLLVAQVVEASYAVPAVVVALLAAGLLWWAYLRGRRPHTLAGVGVFDCPESTDVLPGAGVFALDATGQVALVGRGGPSRTRGGPP